MTAVSPQEAQEYLDHFFAQAQLASAKTWAEVERDYNAAKAEKRKALLICDPMDGIPLDAVEEGQRLQRLIWFWLGFGTPLGNWIAATYARDLEHVCDLLEAHA